MNVLQVFESISHHFVKALPFIPTYIHVLFSALFAIYTSCHASLSIPSSAAKRKKNPKPADSDSDSEDEDEASSSLQKLEGLSPSDAIMFPFLAGCTLTGLYFLIKWLEDPAILNMILNWYFSIFGVLSVARMFTDAMGLGNSFIFPAKYASDGSVWEIKPKRRCAQNLSEPSKSKGSPLPGIFSKIKLPPYILERLWVLREVPLKRIHVRIYIHRILEASLRLGPDGSASFVLALAAVLYYNLVAKPWWLTNILGYGFTYTALQFMSPTTFWTGTLILTALFFYDIYFVFFTPLMVTVATKIDIPAKMLFPRPADPDHDPAKSLAMLGLGDIVLPGIFIGMALRFDLYLFYLRKQKRAKPSNTRAESNGSTVPAISDHKTEGSSHENPEEKLIKAEYQTATGSWGTRFWLSVSFASSSSSQSDIPALGVTFPKPYFHASLLGYTVGMTLTLCIMQVYGHAQPALLYLVPGVLISLWGTALLRGELQQVWDFDEMSESDDTKNKEKPKPEGGEAETQEEQTKTTKKSIFSFARQEEIAKRLQGLSGEEETRTKSDEEPLSRRKARKGGFYRDRKTELVFFSVNLPGSRARDADSSGVSNEGKGIDEVHDGGI